MDVSIHQPVLTFLAGSPGARKVLKFSLHKQSIYCSSLANNMGPRIVWIQNVRRPEANNFQGRVPILFKEHQNPLNIT